MLLALGGRCLRFWERVGICPELRHVTQTLFFPFDQTKRIV